MLLASASPAASQPSAPAPAATETYTEYTIVAGDSCLSIAKRELGSASALGELHRLNPGLGATPHRLVPGQKLRLPARKSTSPDANLTAARGDVAVRRPTESSWDAATRGMDLFRAWRVGARERASAEITFRDSSQLRLRENTVVIIYGPSVPRQPAAALRAEIEGGSLEARLTAASGPAPSVMTPSAIATLSRGTALVSVDGAGTSLVANHAGEPVAVRAVTRRIPRGAPVRVQSGMGSRVEKGKLPEPPRPLPAPPALPHPMLVLPTFAAAAEVPIQWQAVPNAIRYRAVVLDQTGQEQNAVSIPPGQTSFALSQVPPGTVRVLLSAIDAAGFEGPPASLEVQVVQVAIRAPGATEAAPAASTLSIGATLSGPANVPCTLTPIGPDGAALGAGDAVARRIGPHLARCGDPSASVAVPVEVTGLRAEILGGASAVPRQGTAQLALRLEGGGPGITATAGPGLVIESQAWIGDSLALVLRATGDAGARSSLTLVSGELALASVEVAIAAATTATQIVSPRAASRWRLDLGGLAGLLLPADEAAFGSPTANRDRLTSGATLGASLAVRHHSLPAWALRAELAVTSLSQVGTAEAAWLMAPSLALAGRPVVLGPAELWLHTSLGAAYLATAPGTLEPTAALTLGAGPSLAITRDGLTFELSGSLQLYQPTGVAEVWPSVHVGISSTFAP